MQTVGITDNSKQCLVKKFESMNSERDLPKEGRTRKERYQREIGSHADCIQLSPCYSANGVSFHYVPCGAKGIVSIQNLAAAAS